MKKFFKAVKEICFPSDFTCDVCGKETFGKSICDDCSATMISNDKATCPVCGRRTVRPELCIECKEKPPLFRKAVSAYVYDGGAKVLIKKFKEGAGYLKDYLADKLVERLIDLPDFDCIVSVPLTIRAKLRRGYNQSELLAKAVSVKTGVPYIRRAVVKKKTTKEQKALSRKERAKNLNGCFKVKKGKEISGKRVLVADDILTTGATADEIAKVLLKAGAKEVYLITVASVEYRLYIT